MAANEETGDVQTSPVDKMIEESNQGINDVPDFRTIRVVLTYDGYDPMIFDLRRSLGYELREAQREFFGLTKDDQLKKQQEYRVMFLSELLRSHPTGIPGYPIDLDKKEAFTKYFGDPDMDDMVDHIWVSYQNKVYPKELTLSASE